MKEPKNICPKCQSARAIKSGIVNERQRYACKDCGYHFTVQKEGKKIDPYYVTKAIQLYLEGMSYREIERILGVSHVSVMNWVKIYGFKRPLVTANYHPTYKILSHGELAEYMAQQNNLRGAGMIVTEVGDKYMLIRWERFKK